MRGGVKTAYQLLGTSTILGAFCTICSFILAVLYFLDIFEIEVALIPVQNELDYCGEEPSMSPRVPVQHQYSQPVTNFMNSGFPISSGSSCPTTAVQGIRSEHCDQQSKNSVFSNALSSPVRQSLQHYHITRGGYCPNGGLPLGNGARNNEPTIINNQSRDSSALNLSSNDSAMDMHADSPAHEFIYWYFAHFTCPLPWSSTVQD